MSDNLRDRIKEEVLDGILSMFSENDSVEMAAGYITDAVIRKLGNLRQEPHRFQCGSDGCSRYRIISDWTTDD